MRLLLLPVACVALAASACHGGTPKHAPTSPEGQLIRYFGGRLVSYQCDGRRTGAGDQRVTFEGVTFAQRCGLLAIDFAAELKGVDCASEDDEDACSERLGSMFFARLNERYSNADSTWIANHCRGYPAECGSFEQIEVLYLKSHDARVMDAWDEAAARVHAERAAQRAAEKRRRMAAVGAALSAASSR